MLEQIKYVNTRGEEIVFGENGIYAAYNELRDYTWSYDTRNRRISNVYRDVKKAALPCVFVGTYRETRKKRNDVYDILEYDVASGKQGKIYINGWYMNCWIMAGKTSEYLEDRYLRTEFAVVTDDPVWRKEATKVFGVTGEVIDADGLGYPYGYPYDYAANRYAGKNLENEHPFPTEFKMIIYGPCENPRLKIAGHTYGINGSLVAGETVIVDSREKTVVRNAVDGSADNWFGKRYKPESIFERIPGGISTLAWDGTFGFDLVLYQERSEPPFDVPKEIVPVVPDGALVDMYGVYIMTDTGEYITVG